MRGKELVGLTSGRGVRVVVGPCVRMDLPQQRRVLTLRARRREKGRRSRRVSGAPRASGQVRGWQREVLHKSLRSWLFRSAWYGSDAVLFGITSSLCQQHRLFEHFDASTRPHRVLRQEAAE